MSRRILAGMYALDTSMQQAWRALFHQASQISPTLKLPENIEFSDSAGQALDPGTTIVHTCGYPLMTQYRETMHPLCVACFNVKGCEQGWYHSVFLVRLADKAHTLTDCEDYRAAINHAHSNSGMNVFRAAFAKIVSPRRKSNYFKSVSTTGSHLNSMLAIAQSEADIAAIDAISYDFICRSNPDLASKLRSIGQSASTMGLPFVTQIKNRQLNADTLTDALNRALNETPHQYSALNLLKFKAVKLEDYRSIATLENDAINHGYPDLR
jgi:ABC-type phosphate/phosphonate transport system substrate-binding protein